MVSSTGTGGDTARNVRRTSGLLSAEPQRERVAYAEEGGDRSEAYPDHHLLVVLDGAPSHRSEEIVCPDNVEFLRLPAYSPELDPVERWFQEFRRELSNKAFESVELLQEALDQTLWPYWEDLSRLQRLTGFSWWVEAINTL